MYKNLFCSYYGHTGYEHTAAPVVDPYAQPAYAAPSQPTSYSGNGYSSPHSGYAPSAATSYSHSEYDQSQYHQDYR